MMFVSSLGGVLCVCMFHSCAKMGTESKEDLFNKIHLHMLLEVWSYCYLGDLLAQNGAMEVDDRWFLKSIQPVPPRNEKNVGQIFHFQWPLGAHPNNEGESKQPPTLACRKRRVVGQSAQRVNNSLTLNNDDVGIFWWCVFCCGGMGHITSLNERACGCMRTPRRDIRNRKVSPYCLHFLFILTGSNSSATLTSLLPPLSLSPYLPPSLSPSLQQYSKCIWSCPQSC